MTKATRRSTSGPTLASQVRPPVCHCHARSVGRRALTHGLLMPVLAGWLVGCMGVGSEEPLYAQGERPAGPSATDPQGAGTTPENGDGTGGVSGESASNEPPEQEGATPVTPAPTPTPASDSGDRDGPITMGCTGERPEGNTGAGFYVSNGRIYDANDCPFRPLGFNGLVFWNVTSEGQRAPHEDLHRGSLMEMSDMGANMVRIVTKTPNTADGFGWNASPQVQRSLVEEAIDVGMVPILEMHDATCDEPIAPVRSYWESDAMVQLANDFADSLWINIANESNFDSPEAWRDYYIDTIESLRDRGVTNPIMLDAGARCGQDPSAPLQYGQTVLDADPQHNVVFSFHMYGFWISLPCSDCDGWTPPFAVRDTFQELADTGWAFFIGEFGWDEPGTMEVRYDPQVVLEEAERHGFGWAFWAWYEDMPQFQAVTDLAGSGGYTPAGMALSSYLQANASPATVFQ